MGLRDGTCVRGRRCPAPVTRDAVVLRSTPRCGLPHHPTSSGRWDWREGVSVTVRPKEEACVVPGRTAPVGRDPPVAVASPVEVGGLSLTHRTCGRPRHHDGLHMHPSAPPRRPGGTSHGTTGMRLARGEEGTRRVQGSTPGRGSGRGPRGSIRVGGAQGSALGEGERWTYARVAETQERDVGYSVGGGDPSRGQGPRSRCTYRYCRHCPAGRRSRG